MKPILIGMACLACIAVMAQNESSTSASSTVTTGFVVTNGVPVGITVSNAGTVVTYIVEPSGAVRPVASAPTANTTAATTTTATASRQSIGQRVIDAVGLRNGIGSQDDQLILFVTEEGEVILRGTVSSEAERKNLETKVQAVNGVHTVRNELQVYGNVTPPGTIKP